MKPGEVGRAQLRLTCRHLPEVTVIEIDGELDLATADTLQEHSRQECRPGDQVVFDLSRTTFLDCSGIRALLGVQRYVDRPNGGIRLSGLRPGPAKIVALSGAAECLPVHGDPQEAVLAAATAATILSG